MIDLTFQTFGHLWALNPVDERASDGCVQWQCLCECGNKTIVSSNNLRRAPGGSRKPTQSCGCLEGHYTHGHSPKGHPSSMYSRWCNMKARCTNPDSLSF